MDIFTVTAWLGVVVALLYFLMVLAFSLPLYAEKEVKRSPEPAPFVSVVIAARNESANIMECLSDMAKQDYPAGRFEVIVTDDHSEDDTAELCRNFIDTRAGISMVLVDAGAAESGKKAALATAISHSKGELILSTDADTRHERGWISSMVNAMYSGHHVMVLGPVSLKGGKGVFGKMQAVEFLGVMGITAGSASLGIPLMCNGANLMYRKEAYEKAGGFMSNMEFASGDDQFLMMVTRRLYGTNAVVFNTGREAIVTTEAMGTLDEFLQQRIRWVSKSRGYSDPFVIAAGIVTYLLNLLLLTGLVMGIFNPVLLYITGLCFGVKLMADMLVVWPMASFFRRKSLLAVFLPAQVFQVFYVAVTGLVGLILPYRWKGRLIRA
jgi:cellulose synthase/poly-beta-1,6-N-acetylglucosamine synthase-like glycosyltransferase